MFGFYCKKALAVVLASCCGCATIVGKSNYPVQLSSHPPGATVQVVDENGVQVFTGQTPTTAMLRSGAAYFDKKSYVAKFSKMGHADAIGSINSNLSPWYTGGNLLLGGLIGWLIVDPISGSMYEIENTNLAVSLNQLPGAQGYIQDSTTTDYSGLSQVSPTTSITQAAPVIPSPNQISPSAGGKIAPVKSAVPMTNRSSGNLNKFDDLKSLLDRGLITKQEYETKKTELLKQL